MPPDDPLGSDIVLHIGYHKSGSTYLQHLFRRSPVDDLTLGWQQRGGVAWNIGVGETFSPDQWREDVKRALGERTHPVAVVSEELLSGHPHRFMPQSRPVKPRNIDPRRVANRLHRVFPRARVLITFRNQVDYIISIHAYGVAVKQWDTENLSRFTEREWSRGLNDKLKFDALLSHYVNLFSRERVLVLPVEMLRESPKAFNAQVFCFLGLEGEEPPMMGRVNESTKLQAVLNFWYPVNRLFMWQLRAMGALRVPPKVRSRYAILSARLLKSRTTRLLNRLLAGGPRIQMDPAIRELVENHCRASNGRTRELTGLPLENWGYALPERK